MSLTCVCVEREINGPFVPPSMCLTAENEAKEKLLVDKGLQSQWLLSRFAVANTFPWFSLPCQESF